MHCARTGEEWLLLVVAERVDEKNRRRVKVWQRLSRDVTRKRKRSNRLLRGGKRKGDDGSSRGKYGANVERKRWTQWDVSFSKRWLSARHDRQVYVCFTRADPPMMRTNLAWESARWVRGKRFRFQQRQSHGQYSEMTRFVKNPGCFINLCREKDYIYVL